jgi:hypothetical protein
MTRTLGETLATSMGGQHMNASELKPKLKSFKLEPQTPQQAFENLRKMKEDLNLKNGKVDKKKLKDILKRAESFTDEVLATRKEERT